MTEQTNSSDDQGSEVDELLQKKEFGFDLKKAREKAGLSISDVAENLLISADIIRAIENSQADALPALTFTQGYIRSYARMFDLSADEIIAAYVLMAPNSKQVLTPHSVLPAQKSTGDILIKIISFAFIAFAIIGLFYWLNNTDFNIQPDEVENKNSLSSFRAEKFKFQDNNENDYLINQSSEVPESIDVNDSQTASLEKLSDENSKTEAVSEIKVVENADSIVTDELTLTAIGASWCEIQDSTGQRLFYRLLGKGEEVKLQGVAPFKVFLGNAPEVRVEINNNIVDFENLIRSNSNVITLSIESDAAISLTRR